MPAADAARHRNEMRGSAIQMHRKLKAMGLALFAAFAFSAIGAQAASADLFTSTAQGEPPKTVLTSHNDTQHEFSYSSTNVVCKITKFTGTQTGETATSLTITPTYEECTFGGVTAEVRTNHCGYVFTTTTTAHAEETHAEVTIECKNEGEHIEVEVPSFGHCRLTVAQQTTTQGVTYTDVGGNVTVKVTATVDVVRDTNGNFFCELLGHEGPGTYTGSSWMTGYEDPGEPEVTFTKDETSTTEGDQGITHWIWSGDTTAVEIGADTP